MATCNLRLFPRSDDAVNPDYEQEATVSVRLGDLYPVLRRALRSNHTWLSDFQDDEIRVSQDFYDVVRAFDGLRPSA